MALRLRNDTEFRSLTSDMDNLLVFVRIDFMHDEGTLLTYTL